MPKHESPKVFSLRLPDALLQALAEIATAQRRSVNSEMLIALEAHRVRNGDDNRRNSITHNAEHEDQR